LGCGTESAGYSREQIDHQEPQQIPLFGFHFHEFDADPRPRDVPHDRIAFEWFCPGEDFDVDQIPYRKFHIRFQKYAAYGEIPNSGSSSARPGKGRVQDFIEVDAERPAPLRSECRCGCFSQESLLLSRLPATFFSLSSS
jgi:hypothetical protein